MADNVSITAGSGTVIGADNISSVLYQRNKIVVGKDGELIGDVGGALVDSDASRSAIYVRERRDIHIAQPTVTVTASSAYTSGNNVGGLITFSSVVATAGNAIKPLGLIVASTQSAGLRMFILRDTPAGTYTNKTAFAISSTDISKVVMPQSSINTETDGTNSFSVLTIPSGDFLSEFTVVGTDAYLLLQTTATPTYPTTSDVKVTFLYERL